MPEGVGATFCSKTAPVFARAGFKIFCDFLAACGLQLITKVLGGISGWEIVAEFSCSGQYRTYVAMAPLHEKLEHLPRKFAPHTLNPKL